MSGDSDTARLPPLFESDEEGAPLIQQESLPNYSSTSDPGTSASSSDNVQHSYRGLKRKFWKNILCLSLSVTLILISFSSLQNLESSINSSAGLGVMSLFTLYFSVVIGCFFSPIIVEKCGDKISICLMIISQIIYAACNFYPKYWVLLPASSLVGFTSALFWTAIGAYILKAAKGYANIASKNFNKILSIFSGVFVGFWQSAQVIGNLICSVVLSQKSIDSLPDFVSFNFDYSHGNYSQMCGSDYCPMDHATNLTIGKSPNKNELNTLLWIYVGCCVTSLLLCLFAVDMMHETGANEEAVQVLEIPTSCRRVFATLKKHKDPQLLLLIPIFIYNGLSQGFIFGDYTKACVACALGVSEIGLAMLVFGIADVVGSLAVGATGALLNRIPFFLCSSILNISVMMLIRDFDPSDWPTSLFYIASALWGLADSIWQTRTTTMLGEIFKEDLEPSWASFLMWQAAGLSLGFIISRFLCLGLKITIMLGILGFSVILYICMELFTRRRASYPERLISSSAAIN